MSIEESDVPVDINEEDEVNEDAITGTLDDLCLGLLKNSKARPWSLNDRNIEIITENMSKGISMSSSAMYLGISPSTPWRWFKRGKDEVEALTEEQLASAEGDIESLVSLNGVFYIKATRARAESVVAIHESLYERSFESGKEYVAMYLLERQEPEKYNLKYKAQQEDDANARGNVVEFRFVNGVEDRDEEDVNFITAALDSLKTQYAERDLDKKEEPEN